MHGRIEQQAIGALVRAARAGESGALVFEGDAGIGKTCICDYAAECAVGFTVVRACGTASEYGVPFSGLSQLLAPLVGDLPNLPDPQRDALAIALALAPASPTAPLALGAATLSLLACAADRRPIIGIVDDAHWLDAASADAIAFAARRLGRDRVALVVAQCQHDGYPIDTTGLSSFRLAGLPPDATRPSYGEWLRQRDRVRNARPALNAARVTFELLGTTLWLERSASELTANREDVTPMVAQWSHTLTPRELQVALTIAEGATNKEAAATLFLSPKTIEFHLGNVYRKLGVGSRSQLTRLICDVPSRSIV